MSEESTVATVLKTLKDRQGLEWTPNELQALVLQVKSFTEVGLRLGLKRNEISKAFKNLGVVSCSDYVRNKAKNHLDFLSTLITYGGIEKYAKAHGVSAAHIRNVLDEENIQYKPREVNQDDVDFYLDKFGSVLMVARILNTSVNEVKKACPDWKDKTDPTKMAGQAVATGRLGENYWKSLRGNKTLQCLAEVNPSYPGYDFLDSEFGKVNVKSSRVRTNKKKTEDTWTWEVSSAQEADVFPLVAMKEDRTPLGIIMLTRDENRKLVTPTGLRGVVRSNGDEGFSLKTPHGDITGVQWWNTNHEIIEVTESQDGSSIINSPSSLGQ